MNAVVASASTMPTVTHSRRARSNFLSGRILTQAATLLVARGTSVRSGAEGSSAPCCKRSGSESGLAILNHRRNQVELQCNARGIRISMDADHRTFRQVLSCKGPHADSAEGESRQARSDGAPPRGFSYHQLRFHHSFFGDFDTLDAL